MGLRMPAVAAALLVCTGLLTVPAGALASGTPAPPPSRPAAGHPVAAHRPICRGSCRGTGPVHRVHPPENPKYRKPAKLAEVPAGSWGFDMNGWGCNGTSFEAGAAPAGITNAPGLAFDSIQLNGWGWADMSIDNKCFNAELQWYQQNDAGNPIQFIMFPVPYNTNDCGSYSQNTSQGYSAGWGQAQMIYNKAVAAGLPVSGGMWWLDVEQTTDCYGWNITGADSAINSAVIQGAVDFLHTQGLTVGIYTAHDPWNEITGSNHTQFADIPAWNANPYDNSPFVTVYNNSGQNINSLSTVKQWAQTQCGLAGWTGGPQIVVQYMWGDTSAAKAGWYQTDQPPAILGRDFDYTCQQIGTPSGPPSIALLNGSAAMGGTMSIHGTNFGGSQSSSYVHLWFTPDNPHSCATDGSTINWGVPGNWAAFTVSGWSNNTISFQVPTPSGPDRELGSSLGNDLWLIPPGDTGCLTVTTSGGTSGISSFTAQSPVPTSWVSTGYTVGFNGPGVDGFAGGNHNPGISTQLVCSEGGGQGILDQQGAVYPVWDLVDNGGSFSWVWDGEMNTPPGGLTTHCSAIPAANPVPTPINAIAAIAGFQVGQPMDVFGSGFGSSMGSGYVHLWTNNTAGNQGANCGNGGSTSINWGEPGNSAAFTLDSWSDTRVVFGVPTPSGPGQSGSGWQILPDRWGCVTIVNSGGGATFAGQYTIFVAGAPVTQSWTTSGAANLRLGPSTAGTPQGTASPGQSLTLICYDPNGQSINGYATWDQLSSGLWVYDGLMNTPPGGPTGLPKCANYPPDL